MVITFCKNKCCPVVEVVGEKVHLGDAYGPEGVTVWTKQNFDDFLEAAKAGKFDHVTDTPSIALCPCGLRPAGDCDCIDLDVEDARDCECGKMSIRYCKPDTCIKDK